MDDKNLQLFQTEFNRYVKVGSRPERLSGEAGGVILREVTERLGIVKWPTRRLHDPRSPDLVTHPLPELLHTSLSCLPRHLAAQAGRGG